jgi:hypothetical protein
MVSSPITVQSRVTALVRLRPRQRALGADLARRRRTLQVALGLIWLLDAALQFQPYMFTKAFVSQVIRPGTAGNPAVIAGPITWSADLMASHVAVFNALFASIQLLLGAGLLYRPTAKAALAASIPWALGVWWIGEGLGGLLAGTGNPLTGAPGAAVLYVLIALLARPHPEGASHPESASVATTGWLGSVTPRIAWAGLWGSYAISVLQSADRAPGALGGILSGMRAGEPGWVGAIDGALARAIAHLGPEVSVTIAVLCAVAAATVALGRAARFGVLVAAALGAVIWLAEDFGAILTGQGTDPNTGLLLIVIAAAFWPLAAGYPDGPEATRRYQLAPVTRWHPPTGSRDVRCHRTAGSPSRARL